MLVYGLSMQKKATIRNSDFFLFFQFFQHISFNAKNTSVQMFNFFFNYKIWTTHAICHLIFSIENHVIIVSALWHSEVGDMRTQHKHMHANGKKRQNVWSNAIWRWLRPDDYYVVLIRIMHRWKLECHEAILIPICLSLSDGCAI